MIFGWKKYIIIGFCFFGTVLPVQSDIYMFIDSKGVLNFTNVPVSSNYQLFIKEIPKRKNDEFSKRYDNLISSASKRYGVSFSLIKAMIKVESNFNPNAVSRAGAIGLMQIMPANLKHLDISDPYNAWENVMGGANYFRQLLDRFNGKVPFALAAYNAGPSMVEKYKNIPPFPETKRYVKKVMKSYNILKKNNP
ncbi:MAG: lytic transglycosylase domain-containing protein [Desulfobacterales bacterium]|mgnify:CR=1 FL=1|jgi:soluble lytic murein transglycosylase-like protein|nr:lytic transglycosylase domain-containing protein [Desulfobacteraceae bacterium]MBT4364447.1 lytic transglycosylase domain-containing protein [Desulfobacteraceae bacterium]MBT7085003.1 lytic transglycosylase domain-containing protein [Desulfobacterales bacterium]